MDHRKRWIALLLAVLFVALAAACEETQTPLVEQVGDGDAVGSAPTRTVKPIVSFTPRFTATPIPSLTYTPSITPEASDTSAPPTATATLLPTPTPTVQGEIRSTENVNLREGPGFGNPVVLSVPSGTELGVIGMQEDAQGTDWYKVAYVDEDGEERLLWVIARLVITDYEDVISQPIVTPTAAEQPDTPAAGPSGTPRTVAPPPTLDSSRVEILAYCRQKALAPPAVTTQDNVYIEWSWFVSLPDYMDEHLTNADYDVRLDGELLENWEDYAQEMKKESGVWIVYWYYPVGQLAAGEHKISYRLTWDEAITDGYEQFGPGTPNEVNAGDCTFTVTSAES